MTNSRTIVITGSSGLVGSALVAHFSSLGYSVRALQRQKPARPLPSVTYYLFDLANVREDAFVGADYVIHCAYRPVISRRDRGFGVNVDVEGTKKIIELARKHSVRLIFLSTLSAHPGAVTYYAKNKLVAESLFDLRTDLVLRLGIVLGGSGGLFGKIMASLRNHKIVPLIGGSMRAQTVAIDDLCRVVEFGVTHSVTGRYAIAHPTVVTMKQLYRGIADAGGIHPLFIPVPLRLVYACAWLAEEVGIRLPFTSQSILGIKDINAYDTSKDLSVFRVNLKDCKTALSRLHLHDEL